MLPTGTDDTRLRVLVVNDDLDETSAFCNRLEVAGCRTAVAFGGATAAAIADLFHPRLVFVKQQLPDCTALDVLRALRGVEQPEWQTLHVCAYDRDPGPLGREAGFDEHVGWPVPAARLAELLSRQRERLATSNLLAGAAFGSLAAAARRRS